MTTNFVRDNTALWDDKTDRYPVLSPSKQWDAAAIALTKAALLDIQTYLRSGTFDAASTITIKDLDLLNTASASVGPEMDWGGFAGRWFIGIDVANSPASRDFVATGVRGTYSFPDGVTNSGSPTLTSASGGNFVVGLIGSAISGSGIPAGTTIIAVGGLTTLTMSANATATATNVQVTITKSAVQDLMYWKHRGGLSPTLGIGVTPPDGTARVQISPEDTEPAMGGMGVRVGPTQTGKAFKVFDSGAVDRLWVDAAFYISGLHALGGAAVIQADQTNNRPLLFTDKTKANVYGFSYPGGNALRIEYITGGFSILDFESDGGLRHRSTRLGFYGGATTTKLTVSGAKGGNAALTSLLTQLATLGLITDGSS